MFIVRRERMKRQLLLLMSLFILVACQPTSMPSSETTIDVHVLSTNNNDLLVIHEDHGLIRVVSDQEIKTGDVLKITFNGGIMESYPAQLSGVSKIEVSEHMDHELVLYFKIMTDLYEHHDLVHQAKEIALTLNVVGTQKHHLIYWLNETLDGREVFDVPSWNDLSKLSKLEKVNNEEHYLQGVYIKFEKIDEQTIKVHLQTTSTDETQEIYLFEKVDGSYQLELLNKCSQRRVD